MKSLITISFIILLFLGCSDGHSIAPRKVKGIPGRAFWVGGADGGSWYLIDSFNISNKTASIKIYNDQDGSLELDKTFKLQCGTEKKINWNKLQEEISGFNGKVIQLKTLQSENQSCYFE